MKKYERFQNLEKNNIENKTEKICIRKIEKKNF